MNVLLIVFDTLRADHISAINSDAVKTPNIDRVATDGLLFENAFSTGPGTPQGHAGLFTGHYPSNCGVVGGGDTLSPTTPTISEVLQDAGYSTFGICGPGKISSRWGYDRGFDTYRELFDESITPELSRDYARNALTDHRARQDCLRTIRRGPDQNTSLKFDLLQDGISGQKDPWFAFANFLTPHAPYDPPRPHKQEATPSLSRPKFYISQFLQERFGRKPESIERDDVRPERVFRAAAVGGHPYFDSPDWLTDAEMYVLKQWYRAEIRYLDNQFGEFWNWFQSTPDADNTLVILTADHGEYFGEHDLLYHGIHLFDEVLNVPLILNGPDIPANLTSELASLADIFSTICDWCDIDGPPADGQSLLSPHSRSAILAEYGIHDIDKLPFGDAVQDEIHSRYTVGRKCIRTETEKLILNSDGEETLYDVTAGEIVREDADRTRELRERMAESIPLEFQEIPYTDSDERGRDETLRRNLRELGYIE